ncbi:MAG: SdrD B-like domain-containing protein [Saprospiraceae bacterium]
MSVLKLFKLILLAIITWNLGSAQSIQGLVWDDADLDGIIDSGESGFSGVPVFLIRCNGQFIQSTVTDSNGEYEFLNLVADSYKIFINKSFLPSPSYMPTIYDGLNDNDIQANYYSLCSTVTQTVNINAGFGITSSLGDFVWEDINFNGIQDFGEPGIPNVIVSAYMNGSIIAQTATNAFGTYLFENLYPGTYTLLFEMEENFFPTKLNVGNSNLDSDIISENNQIWSNPIDLSANQIFTDIDAGAYRCIEFCGHIYNDANNNNLFDSFENGINQLDVQLWQIIGLDTILAGITVTGQEPGLPSDDGYYRFCVSPGTYFIKVIMPSSIWIAGSPFVGLDPTIYNHITHQNGTNATNLFTVLSGDTYCNLNNGFYCSPTIESYVWEDTDQDGIIDIDENKIPNVAVYLMMDPNVIKDATETDENGKFTFDSIQPGMYYLSFSSNMTFTTPFVGGNASSTVDSKVDGTNGYGTTPYYYLGPCTIIDFLNAGVLPAVLPVEWKSVSAQLENTDVMVYWQVYNAINVSHYMIFSSRDAIHWDHVESIKATDSDTYSFIGDAQQFHKYMKIVAVDWDSRRNESFIVNIDFGKSPVSVKIFPNPTDDKVYIEHEGFKHLTIYDIQGKRITEVPLQGLEYLSCKSLGLKFGTYVFQFHSNFGSQIKKVVYQE